MSKKTPKQGINVDGDVSGTIVYGDHNQVSTTHRGEVPTPPENRQDNTAHEHGNVIALTHGTMNVTVEQPAPVDGREGGDEAGEENA